MWSRLGSQSPAPWLILGFILVALGCILDTLRNTLDICGTILEHSPYRNQVYHHARELFFGGTTGTCCSILGCRGAWWMAWIVF